jgi:hypothetical protein
MAHDIENIQALRLSLKMEGELHAKETNTTKAILRAVRFKQPPALSKS